MKKKVKNKFISLRVNEKDLKMIEKLYFWNRDRSGSIIRALWCIKKNYGTVDKFITKHE